MPQARVYGEVMWASLVVDNSLPDQMGCGGFHLMPTDVLRGLRIEMSNL